MKSPDRKRPRVANHDHDDPSKEPRIPDAVRSELHGRYMGHCQVTDFAGRVHWVEPGSYEHRAILTRKLFEVLLTIPI